MVGNQEGLSEHELQIRLTSVSVGVWLTVIVSLGAVPYALLTWDEPNRALILGVLALGLLSAPVIRAMPMERILHSHRRELFFIAWTTSDLALIALCAALDGGSHSPFVLLLPLPFLFGALTYPLRVTALIGCVAVAA